MAATDRIAAGSSPDLKQSIFLQEEFKGEVLINYIRIVIIFVLEFTTLGKFDVFGNFRGSLTLTLTTIMLVIALVYSVILLILFRKKIYHPVIKYISAGINITLVVLSIAIYRLEPYPEYSQISQLARYSIIYLFYLFSILNYNVKVAVFTGILATSEYFIFVIYGNYFSDLAYRFTGADGLEYTSQFKSSEQILKLVYIAVGAAVAGVVASRLRNLVKRVITEQQEKLVLEQERQKLIEAVNNENRKYLENVSEGLVLIDKSLAMKDQYSRAFVDIFLDENIAGRNFIDFLFPDKEKQQGERKELENFLTILFNNQTADIDMILDINPMKNRLIMLKDKEGQPLKKIIQVDFKRVFTENNNIENILAVVNDRTKTAAAEQALEDEKSRREKELDVIQSILKLSPATLADFFSETHKQLNRAETVISGILSREKIDEAFREIHSLRGTSRSLGFRSLSDSAYDVEKSLVQIRDDQAAQHVEIPLAFLKQFSILYDEMDKIQGLFDRFRYFVTVNLHRQEDNLQSQLEEFAGLLSNMTTDLSKSLGKEIVFKLKKRVDGMPYLNKIRNPLIHLVRNAIDHGIEDPYERLSKGKTGLGTIQLTLNREKDKYIIDVQDDGRGIDFEAVRQKAIAKNLLPAHKTGYTQSELLRFIFVPGFSSKDRHTDISGSGVGLDIVKNTVARLGGKIQVVTKENKGTRFRILLPAKEPAGITIPEGVAI